MFCVICMIAYTRRGEILDPPTTVTSVARAASFYAQCVDESMCDGLSFLRSGRFPDRRYISVRGFEELAEPIDLKGPLPIFSVTGLSQTRFPAVHFVQAIPVHQTAAGFQRTPGSAMPHPETRMKGTAG